MNLTTTQFKGPAVTYDAREKEVLGMAHEKRTKTRA